MDDPVKVAAGLSEAQKRAVVNATWANASGVWHPEGWYCAADKRVRYALCRASLTSDYLRRSNRLTPLGIAVRQVLERGERAG